MVNGSARYIVWLIFLGMGFTGTSDLGAQASPRPSRVEASTRPANTLVVSLPPGGAKLPWQALVLSDEAQALNVRLEIRPEENGQPSPRFAWLQQQHAAPGMRWLLLGPGDRLYGQGTTRPTPEALAKAMLSQGARSSVAEMRRFLGDHPHHAEARAQLVDQLEYFVSRRLRILAPAPVGDLEEALDHQVWGAYATELRQLFAAPSWAGLWLSVGNRLSVSLPERHSPLMRRTYQSIRTQVLGLLQAMPEHPMALALLTRIDGILDTRDVLDTYASLPMFSVPGRRIQLPHGVPRRLLAEGRRRGEVRKVFELLKQNWEVGVLLDLHRDPAFDDVPDKTGVPSRPMGPDARRARQADQLMRAWNHHLSPLLEAALAVGQEAYAFEVLTSLDERWQVIDVPGLATRLVESMNRDDLREPWQRLEALTPPPKPPGRGLLVNRAYRLYHQQLSFDLPHDLGLRAHDLSGWVLTPRPDERERAWLGWNAHEPRWALVDPDGKILLDSRKADSRQDVLQQIRAAGIPRTEDLARRFLTHHPDHVGARIAMLPDLAKRLNQTFQFPHTEGPNPTEAVTDAYFSVLKAILELPYGQISELGWLWPVDPCWPSFGGPETSRIMADPLLQTWAQRCLPLVEAQLKARPSDTKCWQAWRHLALIADRPLAPLLEQLAKSPYAPLRNVPFADDDYPPDVQIIAYTFEMRMVGLWDRILRHGLPDLERRLKLLKGLPAGEPDPVLSRIKGNAAALAESILEACLRLGDEERGGQLIQACIAARVAPARAKGLFSDSTLTLPKALLADWQQALTQAGLL